MHIIPLILAVLVPSGMAQEIDWKPDLKSGLEEARLSGRGVFLVTRWKDGV